jgi:predicted TIM-barrel fold metal-dependent hydrolase
MHGHTSVEDRTSAARLASAAAEMGVRRVVLLGDVLAFGYHPTPEQIRIINDATIADVAAFPDLYVGLCYLSPEHDPDFLAAEAERCIRGHGLKGVKLEATVRARDARLDPIMEALRRLGGYLAHHAWYQADPPLDAESTPADIAHLAARFPDVPIQMAHLGGARVRGILDIRPYPNVVVDTSGSQPMGEMIEYAVRTIGADRIVYGSDVPGRDFSAQLGRVWGARLGEADLHRILHRNAERLLGL